MAGVLETHAAKKLVLECQMTKTTPTDSMKLKEKCVAVPVEDKENNFSEEVSESARSLPDLVPRLTCGCLQNNFKPKDGKRKLRRLGQAPPLVDDTF